MSEPKLLSSPSIRRLPSYLSIVQQAKYDGATFISGTIIAQELGVEPIQVRKDLAITGIIGKPKKGYPVSELIEAIERFLGWDRAREAVIVGAGNLGSALMGYRDFKLHGLKVVAAFDADPTRVGTVIHGVTVKPIEDIENQVRFMGVHFAVLTVPAPVAQMMADRLVAAGVNAIWNFTTVKLKVPPSVAVQREDLSSGYALLCVKTDRREGPDSPSRDA